METIEKEKSLTISRSEANHEKKIRDLKSSFDALQDQIETDMQREKEKLQSKLREFQLSRDELTSEKQTLILQHQMELKSERAKAQSELAELTRKCDHEIHTLNQNAQLDYASLRRLFEEEQRKSIDLEQSLEQAISRQEIRIQQLNEDFKN